MTFLSAPSIDIQWQIVRKNSSFLKRQRGIDKLFSTEAGNPAKKNSMRFNGLVNKKVAGVEASADGQALVVTLKKAQGSQRPAESKTHVELKRGGGKGRRILKSVKALVDNYKPAHSHLVLRRASHLLRAEMTKDMLKRAQTMKKSGKAIAKRIGGKRASGKRPGGKGKKRP